jgi:hypothetical protein
MMGPAVFKSFGSPIYQMGGILCSGAYITTNVRVILVLVITQNCTALNRSRASRGILHEVASLRTEVKQVHQYVPKEKAATNSYLL